MSRWLQARPVGGHLIHAVLASSLPWPHPLGTEYIVLDEAACGVRGRPWGGLSRGMRVMFPTSGGMPFTISRVWGPPLGACSACARVVRRQEGTRD